MNDPEIGHPHSVKMAGFQSEPVEFSGSIQPYGLLLVLSNPDLKILQVSANIEDHTRIAPQDLLNHSLQVLLKTSSFEAFQQSLKSADDFYSLTLPILTPTDERAFNGMVHRMKDFILLELEPALAPVETLLFSLQAQVRRAIAQLKRESSLNEFFQLAAEQVRSLTGFDRVMVYQFDAQGAGAVIAEAKEADLPPYLGLHYPATDIPETVRQLYQQGLVRFIPDLGAPAVEIIPAQNPVTQRPLDLSPIALRGVDPCCVEYHQNMGVAAILVISLVKDETLWGLISCHHRHPKLLPYEVREACELLGEFVTSELSNKVNYEELDYIVKLRSLQSAFVESISQVDNLKEALVNPEPRLLELVNARGAAVCLEDEIVLVGATPTVEQVKALIQWAAPQIRDTLFHTDSLPKLYSDAIAYKEVASGLLLLQISRVRQYYILWFRPEVLQTVDWAGNPSDSVQMKAGGTPSPRQSFARWQETVQLTSLPWKPYELDNALDLRNAIVGIVLRKADELARINQELERSNQELDSFAYVASHDLKEPLRGIHNYSKLLLKDYAEALDETGKNRLQTLVRLTRRMESLIDALLKFSRLGQAELNLQPTDLNPLVDQVLKDLHISYPDKHPDIRIPRSLPTVACDPVLINEVLTNLLSNAFKYNDKAEQWIEIGFIEDNRELETGRREGLSSDSQDPISPSYTFYIRDNGIGIRERHLEVVFRLFKRLHEQNLYGGGTGAGLTIARKIIERHGGQIWVESTYGEGSTFFFTLQ
jgi:chemotaxis family two-component system sensor kinase Cph1